MTATPPSAAASQQAAVDAALLILERMGLSPHDLTAAPRQRPAVPTFAEYVPVVSRPAKHGHRGASPPSCPACRSWSWPWGPRWPTCCAATPRPGTPGTAGPPDQPASGPGLVR
jgi:hypothetical protein